MPIDCRCCAVSARAPCVDTTAREPSQRNRHALLDACTDLIIAYSVIIQRRGVSPAKTAILGHFVRRVWHGPTRAPELRVLDVADRLHAEVSSQSL